MKRFVFLVVSTALFISGVWVFADSPSAIYQDPTEVQKWVGVPADKLVQQLGAPDLTATMDNGGKMYKYFENERGRTVELTFDIASNGNVVSADSFKL